MNREMILEATSYLKPHRDVQMSELNKKYFDLAIEALRAQLNGGWISVEDRLPKCEQMVLVSVSKKRFDGATKKFVCTAMYEDGSISDENSWFDWGDIDMDYSESEDCYFVPKGWFEQNRYCEQFAQVYDKVTHWRPLPQPPQEV